MKMLVFVPKTRSLHQAPARVFSLKTSYTVSNTVWLNKTDKTGIGPTYVLHQFFSFTVKYFAEIILPMDFLHGHTTILNPHEKSSLFHNVSSVFIV